MFFVSIGNSFLLLFETTCFLSLQSGFIPGDPTTNQLTYLYIVFGQALDEEKKSELSSVTSAKHSILFGTNYKQLVSHGKCLPGSKAILIIEGKV